MTRYVLFFKALFTISFNEVKIDMRYYFRMTFIPKISLETRTTASGGNTKDLWVFYIISWAIVISFAGPLLIANELYQEFNTVNVTVEWWESTIFMIAMMPILGILCAVTIGLPGLVIMYAMRKNSIEGIHLVFLCFCVSRVWLLLHEHSYLKIRWNRSSTSS